MLRLRRAASWAARTALAAAEVDTRPASIAACAAARRRCSASCSGVMPLDPVDGVVAVDEGDVATELGTVVVDGANVEELSIGCDRGKAGALSVEEAMFRLG